jgi:hypothetical protein
MNPTLQALRQALQNNRGNVLTDELCVGIEAVVGMSLPVDGDCAVAGLGIPPEEYRSVVFAVERIADVAAEIAPLHEAHWKESEGFRHGLPLRPNYVAWAIDEKAGSFILFTIRQNGVLVGYCQVYVSYSNHTGTKICNEDALFLDPVVRSGFICSRFAKYAEKVVKSLGVREVRLSVKVTNDIWKLWERIGYERTGFELVKVLEE